MTHDPLTLTMRVIHDDLNRLDALGHTTGRRTASAEKPGQLGAQIVVNGFVESHPHHAALVRRQAEPPVTENRDMHAPADEPPRPIDTTQAAAPIGAKRVHRTRRDLGIRGPRRIAPGCRRQGAQSDRDTHDELLFGRARKAARTQDTSPTV
ncbi:MAG: hypothetical protein QOD69_2939 [Solirubrobacteraceae bacterium]|nr:hypothetical protein [Solirubrobacteraceae bacterium]